MTNQNGNRIDLEAVSDFLNDIANKKYLQMPTVEKQMLLKYRSELAYIIENNLCKGRGMESVLYLKKKIDKRLDEISHKAKMKSGLELELF